LFLKETTVFSFGFETTQHYTRCYENHQLKGCVEELSNLAFCCFGKTHLIKVLLMKHLFISFILVAPKKTISADAF